LARCFATYALRYTCSYDHEHDHGGDKTEEDKRLRIVLRVRAHRFLSPPGSTDSAVEVVLGTIVVITFVLLSATVASPLNNSQIYMSK
jgi:hypothetical protein